MRVRLLCGLLLCGMAAASGLYAQEPSGAGRRHKTREDAGNEKRKTREGKTNEKRKTAEAHASLHIS